MPETLPLEAFIRKQGAILDVRSPAEHQQGRIPDSYNIPLFKNVERTLIGTVYKQESQAAAIDLGLKIIGPKLYELVQMAKVCLQGKEGKILCWRGGMRSGFMARLLESINLSTFTLQGGYRSFRRWILQTLNTLPDFRPHVFVLGGLTGSGKTSILQTLQQLGEQVIDLETIACHRGSSFGHIGYHEQPSQEQFENEIGFAWSQFDFSKPIWIEDEGRLIGKCHLPPFLSQLMSTAPLFFIERSLEERLHILLELYGQASSDALIQSTLRLCKRLGRLKTQEIVDLIIHNHKKEAFKQLLLYYDQAYYHQLTRRNLVYYLKENNLSYLEWSYYLLKITKHLELK
jgi:tRNA 2-selenouridine synthase